MPPKWLRRVFYVVVLRAMGLTQLRRVAVASLSNKCSLSSIGSSGLRPRDRTGCFRKQTQCLLRRLPPVGPAVAGEPVFVGRRPGGRGDGNVGQAHRLVWAVRVRTGDPGNADRQIGPK